MWEGLRSDGKKFRPQRFETQAEVENGVTFPRKERVDVLAGKRRDLLKGQRLKFVPYENLALLFREFGQSSMKLFPKEITQMFGARGFVIAQKESREIEPRVFLRFRHHRVQRGHFGFPVTVD